MLSDHDQDVLPRCPRLGHELTFGYCRRETGGKPCRLILDCWWERFDVRSFLQAHLPEEAMAQVERAGVPSRGGSRSPDPRRGGDADCGRAPLPSVAYCNSVPTPWLEQPLRPPLISKEISIRLPARSGLA
jgi:hypothetical protein